MPIDVKVPAVGESVSEVTIATWVKNDGDYVEMDDVICEIESDKATFELNAEDDGVLKIEVGEGETVNVGDKIASIDTDAEQPEKKDDKEDGQEGSAEQQEKEKEKSVTAEKGKEQEGTYAFGVASPAASKILKERGISPEQVKGTGKDGRITKEDAMAAEPKSNGKAEEKQREKEPEAPEAAPQPSMQGGSRDTNRKKMSTLRKTVAKRLVKVKNETAMLTTFNEVDMSNVMALRKQYKEKFKEKHEVGLGFMSFFAKAVTEAVREFPEVNASIDGEEVVYHDYVDLGIAVSTPRGLVVPNIRNAESMTLAEIEKSVIYYAKKARDNKIGLEEMEGGTFTITNGGVFGSMLSTPILNAPQSAILGMHNIVERPVAVNGQVEIRPVMYVALSYDHRIVDGKESVSFLYRIKEYLEDPARLLLGV